jgi:hypothetical protein
MNRSKHRVLWTVHIGLSSGSWKQVARGTGLDSPRPNVWLSCIPFCVSSHLNIFLCNSSPVLSNHGAEISSSETTAWCTLHIELSFFQKRVSPAACNTPRVRIFDPSWIDSFWSRFQDLFWTRGLRRLYLGDRNTLERINCSGNAKPSIYSWCVHLFKQIYSIIWHKHRESLGRGVRFGTHRVLFKSRETFNSQSGGSTPRVRMRLTPTNIFLWNTLLSARRWLTARNNHGKINGSGNVRYSFYAEYVVPVSFTCSH